MPGVFAALLAVGQGVNVTPLRWHAGLLANMWAMLAVVSKRRASPLSGYVIVLAAPPHFACVTLIYAPTMPEVRCVLFPLAILAALCQNTRVFRLCLVSSVAVFPLINSLLPGASPPEPVIAALVPRHAGFVPLYGASTSPSGTGRSASGCSACQSPTGTSRERGR